MYIPSTWLNEQSCKSGRRTVIAYDKLREKWIKEIGDLELEPKVKQPFKSTIPYEWLIENTIDPELIRIAKEWQDGKQASCKNCMFYSRIKETRQDVCNINRNGHERVYSLEDHEPCCEWEQRHWNYEVSLQEVKKVAKKMKEKR